MINPIAIIAGEPNSISSEIIFKSWRLRKKNKYKPLLVIGSFDLLILQKKKLKFPIKIKKLKKNFNLKDLKGNKLPVYNINYKQKKPFEKISTKSNLYIFECFNAALKLVKMKKIFGFINCPISKETLFKNSHKGITEYLSQKEKMTKKTVMLIFNKKLSVSPLTTHIPISEVSKKINKSYIVKKIKIINNFYRKNLKKIPNFAILGLDPHNFSNKRNFNVKKLITSAVREIRKSKIKISGPISPDTSFMLFENNRFDVIFGMYHDQVLTPFKALFKYSGINITLGLPYFRVSPDHGIAENIVGKNIANPKSLIESIKFFNFIK